MALLEGIKDGTIDCVTSDHNPIDVEDKKVEFDNAKYGTIGLESAFGQLANHLDLETIVKVLATNPKKVFGIETHSIQEGNLASLSLFSPKGKSIFNETQILSTSKNAIFLNKEMTGNVYGIYANKQLVLK